MNGALSARVWKGVAGMGRVEGAIGMVARAAGEAGEAEAIGAGKADARRTAFARLTDVRLSRAYRLAAIVLDDPVEAQDAVHDATLRAWASFADLRDPERFDPWFDRILVNGCRDRLRRRRVRAIAPTEETGRFEPDPSVTASERDALRRVLATLDAEHRLVVILRYVEDLTPAEIAARTGTREGTVRSRLHYALQGLRAAFEAADRLPEGSR
ncbi:MAG: RNA polymerase sigma factor [Chloroflexi bacterium]|nr:RNA polymerase sigma factor [Chloroflexota bacterium]